MIWLFFKNAHFLDFIISNQNILSRLGQCFKASYILNNICFIFHEMVRQSSIPVQNVWPTVLIILIHLTQMATYLPSKLHKKY